MPDFEFVIVALGLLGWMIAIGVAVLSPCFVIAGFCWLFKRKT